MEQSIKQFDTKKAVVLLSRAAALFIERAKKGAADNLLLERHYFRLDLAEPPFALVVMGIRGKNRLHQRGVSR